MKRIISFIMAAAAALTVLTACEEEEAAYPYSEPTAAVTQPTEVSHTDNAAAAPAVTTTTTAPAHVVDEIKAEVVDNNDDLCTATLHLTAYYADGAEAWSYTSPKCCLTELNTVGLITETDSVVYIFEQSALKTDGGVESHGVIAFDRETGRELWRNKDFYGAGVSYAVGNDGTLYVGGYYGPDCVAIDKKGRTLWTFSNDEGMFWLYDMELTEDGITLFFDGSENGDGGERRLSYSGKRIG